MCCKEQNEMENEYDDGKRLAEKNGIDIMTEKDAKLEITTSVQYLFCKE